MGSQCGSRPPDGERSTRTHARGPEVRSHIPKSGTSPIVRSPDNKTSASWTSNRHFNNINVDLNIIEVYLVDMPADPASWFLQLEEEDQQFVKRLVLASGSLKELAEGYDVSYPTIRLRLDRLIERVRAFEDPASDAFEAKLRELVAEGDLPARIGKQLLRIHKETKKGESK